MRRLCDVPRCQKEGTEGVNDGFMCRWHAIQWDKASDRGDVFEPEAFVLNGSPDDDALAAGDCHSRWLGRRR